MSRHGPQAASCQTGAWLMDVPGSCVGAGRGYARDAGKGGLNLLLEAGDQFAVAVDQGLLGFDFSDDSLLGGEGWEGYLEITNLIGGEILEYGPNRLRTVTRMERQQRETQQGSAPDTVFLLGIYPALNVSLTNNGVLKENGR